MPRHIALLRGINVGGKHRLPMKRLVRWFEEAGCSDVTTYIQSGNVLFDASAALARGLGTTLPARANAELGFDVPIVTRSAREWRALVDANPFLPAADERALAVGFLDKRPTKARLAQLDPERGKPDTFAVLGREVYLCIPGGMARSKLTNAYFDKTLGTVVTFRNWRTVLQLRELA